MSSLNLPGISSGIDTQKIIQQLMAINSRKLAKYQTSKNNYEKISSAFGQLKSQMNGLKSSVETLSEIERSFNANSNDRDVLTVSSSSDAGAGSHTVQVSQLAASETWIQDSSSFQNKTDYVGGGHFIYSYNDQERTITTVTDETTLEELVDLINKDEENPGVTAGLIYQGGNYHLMLNGQDTGTDYQIKINTTNTEVWRAGEALNKDSQTADADDKLIELDEFSGTLFGDETITISGKTHDGTAVNQNFDITEDVKIEHLLADIEDAFSDTASASLQNGKITLTDGTCGTSQMQFDLTYNPGSGSTTFDMPTISQTTEGGTTSADLADLAPSSFTETQSAQDARIRVDGFPPSVSEVQTLTPDAPATAGTFTLSYGQQQTAPISYNATTTQIQQALEELSNIDTGDITVTGDPLDTDPVDEGLSFTFAEDAGDVEPIQFNFSGLTGPTQGGSSITETAKGEDPWIERNSNSINDVLQGLTLNLQSVSEDNTPVEVNVSRNISSVKSKVNGMIQSYNSVMRFIADQTEYDSENKKMGLLAREIAVTLINSQTRQPFIGSVTGFSSAADTFTQAKDIGISVSGDGTLELDEEEFDQAVEEDFQGVLDLIGASETGNTDSDYVGFYASSQYTEPGEYDVKIECDDQGNITEALIKKPSEEWAAARDVTPAEGNLITCSEEPEKHLQLTFECNDGVAHGQGETEPAIEATVRVKEGFAVSLYDMIDQMTELDTGRIDIGAEAIDGKIDRLEKRIEDEQDKLDKIEQRLIMKYARLEKTLALLQRQQSAVGVMMSSIFGSG